MRTGGSSSAISAKRLILIISSLLVVFLLIIENVSVRNKVYQKSLEWSTPAKPKKDFSATIGKERLNKDDDYESGIDEGNIVDEIKNGDEDEVGENLNNPQSDAEELELIKKEGRVDSRVPKEVLEVEDPSKSKTPRKHKVCTIALNPRQGSLFRTNLMGVVGSGKYRYAIKSQCPWEERRVRLISYVKCCETLSRVTRSVNSAVNEFDVVIVTGDEYCMVTDAKPQFRQYWGTQLMHSAPNVTAIANFQPSKILQDEEEGVRYPLYIPLGPREEFLQTRIKREEIVPPSQRKYLYNFLGSMTSYSRQVLKRVVARDLATPENQEKYPGFVHITDKWHLKVTKSNGYVEPDEYKRVLLQSTFTLCPTGHNPEAYRIFEALEAGSIPILAIDPWYEKAKCQEAFRPFKDSHAPFIYLNGGWRQLQHFFEKRGTNATWVKERQLQVLDWYKNWMNAVALRFEAVLEHRYAKRMKRGRASEAEDRDEAEREAEELEAIKLEESQSNKLDEDDQVAEMSDYDATEHADDN